MGYLVAMHINVCNVLQVEVKDATVKTFAEIMAEKKRKRLLAQQGKPYTPVVFSEPGMNWDG